MEQRKIIAAILAAGCVRGSGTTGANLAVQRYREVLSLLTEDGEPSADVPTSSVVTLPQKESAA